MKTQHSLKSILCFGTVLVAGALLSADAFALGKSRPIDDRPIDNGGLGGISCRAVDRGWEEHSGGHASCSSCKSSGHGACLNNCYRNSFSCEASGIGRDGRKVTFTAYSDFAESDARNRALDRCTYSREAEGCRIENCDTNENLVSSRSCG